MSIIKLDEHPGIYLDQIISDFSLDSGNEKLCKVEFELEQGWLKNSPLISLIAIYHLKSDRNDLQIRATLVSATNDNRNIIEKAETIKAICNSCSAPLINLSDPQELIPVHIPKPWGQEIWYTGVEERGVVSIGREEFCIALPYYLALAPERLAGHRFKDKDLVLLKILDPLPDKVHGSLYLELHEQKQEVYVVTSVNTQTWSGEQGALRLGCNQELLSSLGAEQYKEQFLTAIKDYWKVRSEIEGVFDTFREEEAIGLKDAVAIEKLKSWEARLPSALKEKEHKLRQAMDSYTNLQDVSVGDVFCVPTHTPHSLQGGIRVVEFQTPVYERHVMAFYGKIVTQDYWDTEKALSLMNICLPEKEGFRELEAPAGVCREQIVSFSDFKVERLKIAPKAEMSFADFDSYKVIMSIKSDVQIGALKLKAEQACFVPACCKDLVISNNSVEESIILVVEPVG